MAPITKATKADAALVQNAQRLREATRSSRSAIGRNVTLLS
jgi:hypothetical protein